MLEVNRTRQQAGDIAQVDLDRLELQRVQYESDVQTATVNVRTAKIQLLTLLNDRIAGGAVRCNRRIQFQPTSCCRSKNSARRRSKRGPTSELRSKPSTKRKPITGLP